MKNKYTQEKVFIEFYELVKKYLLIQVNDVFLAEDLCGLVFDKIYEKLDTFDDSKSSIKTWVLTITRNTLIDYYRTRKQDVKLKDDFDVEIENNEGLILKEENHNKLEEALSKLSDKERQIIIHHDRNNISLKDAAKLMNISYPYAKKLHKNAIESLKAFFNKI